jgi:hypothetical protein
MKEQNSCTSSTFNVLDTKQYDLYILQYLPKKKKEDLVISLISCSPVLCFISKSKLYSIYHDISRITLFIAK